jgi:hypothetical protein
LVQLSQHEEEAHRIYRLGYLDGKDGRFEARCLDSILKAAQNDANLERATESTEDRLVRQLAQERADKARLIQEGYGGTSG